MSLFLTRRSSDLTCIYNDYNDYLIDGGFKTRPNMTTFGKTLNDNVTFFRDNRNKRDARGKFVKISEEDRKSMLAEIEKKFRCD